MRRSGDVARRLAAWSLRNETPAFEGTTNEMPMTDKNTPLWEVFIRTRNGMAHRHVGSVHAADATMALQNARDVYTRRGEGLSVWVVRSSEITASDPAEKGMMFEPADSKIYRHPTFYDVPDDVGHM
jgi:ring-1,2-phenylacetyl-CoA epoxidase subunit PaaB